MEFIQRYNGWLVLLWPIALGAVSINAIGKTPLPWVPTVGQCQEMAGTKKNPQGSHPSRQVFLACLVAGSRSTFYREASDLAKQAEHILDQLPSNSTAEELLAPLREAHARINLSVLTARQGRKLKYRPSFIKKPWFYQFKYDALILHSGLMGRKIVEHYARLDSQSPTFKMQRLAKQKITQEYCRRKLDGYKEGRLREPERNFLFVAAYQKLVLPCAEMRVDFYPLLASGYAT